jgi:hypothetical protein
MRVLPGANGGFSAAVVTVADLAFLAIKIAACRGVCGVGTEWINERFDLARNALMKEPGRDGDFSFRRFRAGAR